MPANPYPAVPCYRVFHGSLDSSGRIWSAMPSVTFTKPYQEGEWAEHDAMFVFTSPTAALEAAQSRFGRGVFEVWECLAEVRTRGGRYRARYMRDQALYPLRMASIIDPYQLTPRLHERWLRWTWHASDEKPEEYGFGQPMRVLAMSCVMLCDRLMPVRKMHSITTER